MSGTKGRARLWFVVHGWAGLPIWAFLFVVCLTGTLAVVDREILWLMEPRFRVAAGQGEVPLPLNRVVALLAEQAPDLHVTDLIPGGPGMALEALAVDGEGVEVTLRLDPYTGAVRERFAGPGFPEILEALHGWLLVPWTRGTSLGWYAVTALSLPMLLSLVSGLVVYKRFWRALLRWPRVRVGQGARAFWGDLHRLAGVWGLWFVPLIAASGVWFLVEGILIDARVPLFPVAPLLEADRVPHVAPGAPVPEVDIDGALAAAERAQPGMRPRRIMLPKRAVAPIAIFGPAAMPLFNAMVWVDPYDEAVLKIWNRGNASTIQVVSMVACALHFGQFAGLAVKLLWVAGGVILSGLVASGMLVWTVRTARATRAVLTAESADALARSKRTAG